MSTTAVPEDEQDLECRVCRSGSEDGRPLYTPCLCSGSIGLVHQDCLEAWLSHSRKDTCELCHSKYQFVPEYAEDSPSSVPVTVWLKSIVKILVKNVIPRAFRLILASGIWLICVPFCSTCIYCISVGRINFSIAGALARANIGATVVQGIVIDGMIALTLLILMAFTDFLRFHWLPEDHPLPANGNHANVPAAAAAAAPAAAAAAPVVPVPVAVPAAPKDVVPPVRIPFRPRYRPPAPTATAAVATTDSDDEDAARMIDLQEERQHADHEIKRRRLCVDDEEEEDDLYNHGANKGEQDIGLLGTTQDLAFKAASVSVHTSINTNINMSTSTADRLTVPLVVQYNTSSTSGNNVSEKSAVRDYSKSNDNTSLPTAERANSEWEYTDTRSALAARTKTVLQAEDRQGKDSGGLSLQANDDPETLSGIVEWGNNVDKEREVALKNRPYCIDDADDNDDDDGDCQTEEYTCRFDPFDNPEAGYEDYIYSDDDISDNDERDDDEDANHNNNRHQPNDHNEHHHQQQQQNGMIPVNQQLDLEMELAINMGGDGFHFNPAEQDILLAAADAEAAAAVGVNDAGAEVRLALLEVMGVNPNEPLYIMFRNAAWLLIFCSVFVGIFGAIPYAIGSVAWSKITAIKAPTLMGRYVPSEALQIMTPILLTTANMILPEKIRAVVSLLRQPKAADVIAATTTTIADATATVAVEAATAVSTGVLADNVHYLQFTDLSVIGLGYMSMFLAVYLSYVITMGIKWSFSLSPHAPTVQLTEAPGGAQAQAQVAGAGGAGAQQQQQQQQPGAAAAGLHGVGQGTGHPEHVHHGSFVRTIIDLIEKLAVLVKVGVLLIMRIFLLPLVLGSVMLFSCIDLIAEYPAEDWCEFMNRNPVGFYALSWVAGISFMLIITLSVLQLREVLHPDICAHLIRPQEQHVDLISSLITESGITHARRVAVSSMVYISLMISLLYTPLWILKTALPLALKEPYITRLHTWYLVPEIQVPLELLVGHILFLSVLDKYRNILGHLQFRWLVFSCRRLDLTRNLLPVRKLSPRLEHCFPANRTFRYSAHSPTPSAARPTSTNNNHNKNNNGNVDEDSAAGPVGSSSSSATAVKVDQTEELYMVLQRPPRGWDSRTPDSSTRWAWVGETPSAVEKSILKRAKFLESDASVAEKAKKIAAFGALAVSSWVLMTVSMLCSVGFPLMSGRVLMTFIDWPDALYHDPANFAIGVVIIMTSLSLAKRVVPILMAVVPEDDEEKKEGREESSSHASSTAARSAKPGNMPTPDFSSYSTASAAALAFKQQREEDEQSFYTKASKIVKSNFKKLRRILANFTWRSAFHACALAGMWMLAEMAIGFLVSYHTLDYKAIHSFICTWTERLNNRVFGTPMSNFVPYGSSGLESMSAYEMVDLFGADMYEFWLFQPRRGLLSVLKTFSPQAFDGMFWLSVFAFELWFRGAVVTEITMLLLLQSEVAQDNPPQQQPQPQPAGAVGDEMGANNAAGVAAPAGEPQQEQPPHNNNDGWLDLEQAFPGLNAWRTELYTTCGDVKREVLNGDLVKKHSAPNAAEILRLDKLHHLLIWPVFKSVVIWILIPSVLVGLVVAHIHMRLVLDWQWTEANSTEYVQQYIIAFKVLISFWLLISIQRVALPVLQVPTKKLVTTFKNMVRDDNYLVGRTLQNRDKRKR